jgi:hypothetical protein
MSIRVRRMATTTACAAKWTATKLLVYTDVSNHDSDAIGAIDSGKASSYLFAGAELDRLHERGEVPINPQLVPNLPVQVSILGEASVCAASLNRIPGCATRSAENFSRLTVWPTEMSASLQISTVAGVSGSAAVAPLSPADGTRPVV